MLGRYVQADDASWRYIPEDGKLLVHADIGDRDGEAISVSYGRKRARESKRLYIEDESGSEWKSDALGDKLEPESYRFNNGVVTAEFRLDEEAAELLEE